MIFFIIHWRFSPYSTYFITLLHELKKKYSVVLVDCFDSEADLANYHRIDGSQFFSHVIDVHPQTSPEILKEKVLKFKSDWNLVISNSSRRGLLPGVDIAHQLGCEHFLFEHLGIYAKRSFKPQESIIKRIKSLDQVIVPSEMMTDAFYNYLPENKVHVCPLQPLSKYFKPLSIFEGTSKNRLLYAGNILHSKGIIDFTLKNRNFFDTNLLTLFICGDGTDFEELRNSTQDYMFLEMTTTVPPGEVIRLVESSLAVVVPSFNESYSRILVESLLRGVPVICHKTGIAASLYEKVPGIFFLDDDQGISDVVLDRIKTFSDHEKTSQFMRLFLADGYNVLLDLIRENYERN